MSDEDAPFVIRFLIRLEDLDYSAPVWLNLVAVVVYGLTLCGTCWSAPAAAFRFLRALF